MREDLYPPEQAANANTQPQSNKDFKTRIDRTSQTKKLSTRGLLIAYID